MSRPFWRGSAKSSGPCRSTTAAWFLALPILKTSDASLLFALPDPASETIPTKTRAPARTPATPVSTMARVLRTSVHPSRRGGVDAPVPVPGPALAEGADDGCPEGGRVGLGDHGVDDPETQQVAACELQAGG